MDREAPRLVSARRGFSVIWGGRRLSSGVDPIAAAERAIADVDLRSKTLYLCPSPLQGYGLRAFLERIPADSALLCVEAHSALAELFRTSPEAPEEDERTLFLPSVDPARVCGALRDKWGGRRFRRVVELRTTGGTQAAEDGYRRCREAIERELILDWSNAMTLTRLGRRYALNALRNLPTLAEIAPFKAGCFGDAPILVCGAGPSLDAVGDLVRDGGSEPRKFVIIAVDTALAALMEQGIQPDLVVALEAQHWNLGDFVGVGVPPPLAADFSSLPACLRVPGERRLFSTLWTPLRFFDRLRAAALLPPALPALGSVGLSATALALASGRGPVVVLGLDFSFSVDAYHARGTPAAQARMNRVTRLLSPLNGAASFAPGTVDEAGKDGRPLRTDPSLKNYRDLFEREFAPYRRIFDAGSAGLPLGIPRVDQEEARRLLRGTFGREGRGSSLSKGEAIAGRIPPEPDAKASRAPLVPGGAAGSEPGDATVPRPARRLPCQSPDDGGQAPVASRDRVLNFIAEEEERLRTLEAHLAGERPIGEARFLALLEGSDYLYAHFPDRAGTGERGPSVRPLDQAFLNRVRAELGPFRKALELARRELLG